MGLCVKQTQINWQRSSVCTTESTQEPEQIIQLSFVNWINQFIKKDLTCLRMTTSLMQS